MRGYGRNRFEQVEYSLNEKRSFFFLFNNNLNLKIKFNCVFVDELNLKCKQAEHCYNKSWKKEMCNLFHERNKSSTNTVVKI